MRQFLEATRNKIAYGTFDINEFQSTVQRFEREREELAARVRAGEFF